MKHVLAGSALVAMSILAATTQRTVEHVLDRLAEVIPVLVLRLARRCLPPADRSDRFRDWYAYAELDALRDELAGRPLAQLWSCTRYSMGWLRSGRAVAKIYRGSRGDSSFELRLVIVQDRLGDLRDGDSLAWLRQRDDLRPLALVLRDLLRRPTLAITAEERAQIVEAAAVAGKLCVDDRDERLCRELIDAARPHADDLAPDHPAVLLLDHTSGYVALQLGDHDHAEQVLGDVHERLAAAFGAHHPTALEARRLQAWSLQKQGRLDDAEQGLTTILHALEQAPLADVAQRLHVRCMLGWVQCQQALRDMRHGRKEQAESRFDQSEMTYGDVIDGRETHFGADHHDALDARHSFGKVLFVRGDWRRAHDALQQVTADRQRCLGPAHPDTLESRKYTALAAARLGHQSAALTELRRIHSTQTQVQGRSHPNTTDTRRWLDTLTQEMT